MKTLVRQIGSFAQQVLESSSSALVSGIASRGIYLQPRDNWTIYLSLEDFRGPLTLNLADKSVNLDRIKAGSAVELTPEGIHFQDDELSVSFEGSAVWNTPPIEVLTDDFPGQLDSLFSLVQKIAPENPYLPMLANQVDKIPGVPVISERILNLQKALREEDRTQIVEGSILLLGLGPGLTPIGDDFLLGVLLTLNRWEASLPFSPDLIDNLNQAILDNSRIKTTRISSSLLACVVEGAADERLLNVLDGLCSGKEVPRQDLKNMLRWGSTSGISVLTGMMSVLDLRS